MVQYTGKFGLIYGRNKSTNFPTPVFTELTSCSDLTRKSTQIAH